MEFELRFWISEFLEVWIGIGWPGTIELVRNYRSYSEKQDLINTAFFEM